jgi:ribonucleoside-diphosphate reductase alpha chain
MLKSDTMSVFADTIYQQKYAQEGETWRDTATRVVTNVSDAHFPQFTSELIEAIAARKFMPGGRYLYAAGKPNNQYNNCTLFDVEDSREGWGDLMNRVVLALTTGAGVGVCYSKLREEGAKIKGMGGESTGPLALMQMVNEAGRHIMQGGSRRAALYASLHWDHPDVFNFIAIKDWSDDVKAMKAKDFNFPAKMDGTNISVILDDEFFKAYHDPFYEPEDWRTKYTTQGSRGSAHEWAKSVYKLVIEHMLTTAEPGFQIDTGANSGENLRNACTEITSADNNDICNLGSINMARVETKEEFARLVEISTAFLISGTLSSKVPFEGIAEIRTKNRRLGLGLMGIYEWLVRRGYTYDPNDELAEWLDEYERSTEYANNQADHLGVSRPVKTRAIAPTGSIGILAETTTGIEPLFATAYKRRYLKGQTWHYQYVIDATAQRMMDNGIEPVLLESAYDLANKPERRVAFQAWVQQWVDHGISSTLNLPEPSKQLFTHEEFGEMLIKYLPNLRGITAYPDGARGGQPLNVVPLTEAYGSDGIEYEEFSNDKGCVSGSCGV